MSLVLEHVNLTYPDGADSRVTAVADATLTVPPGRVIALTGPSGCGKSSMLAIAGTLIRPDSGSVTVGDVVVDGLSEPERARVRRDRVGFVFQNDNLLPDLTAVEQLLLTGHVRGDRPRDADDEARELLAEVGLSGAADRLPRQLSGGMRQRVNIARALMGSKDVLLVDEPTSALDQSRGREIVELLVGLAHERDLATLLVTHDLQTLDPGGPGGVDGLVHMCDGKLLDATRVNGTIPA